MKQSSPPAGSRPPAPRSVWPALLLVLLLQPGLSPPLTADSPPAPDRAMATEATQDSPIADPTAGVMAARPRPFLQQLVQQGILPLYGTVETATRELQQQAETFCHQPDAAGLEAVRHAWRSAMQAWAATDGLLFGPAIAEERDFHLWFSPPKKQIIKRLLRQADPLTPATVAAAGVGAQGLATLEYLLFDPEQQNLFAPANSQGCHYLVAASRLLPEYASRIRKDWEQAGAGFFISEQEALEMLVNKFYQSIEKVSGSRLGKALNGHKPYQLDNWRSGQSLAVIQAAMAGIQHLLDQGGIHACLLALHPTDDVRQFIAALRNQVAFFRRLPVPQQSAFELIRADDTAALAPYLQRARSIQLILGIHLAPLIGVNLGFNDNDGD
ncbi:MAG TPA: imelysin family protein [Thiolinea sp.]|nr:imelysin family protein [Thiolinea sp.]